jgi:histone deacetylase complex subunit SAP30
VGGGSEHQQQCCLVENGRRCARTAGNASYNKRIQKTVVQRKLNLHMDNSARHIYICDYHKNLIQSMRTKRKRKDSEDDSGETDSEVPEVDLFQLQVNTLRRYKKHYKVPSRPGLNKAQLADSLIRHFRTIPVVEKEALTFFIYMVKTNKSKFDREKQRDLDAD